MISFTCAACGRNFSVPDASAGRKAKCRCGQELVVPAGAAPPARTETTREEAAAARPRPTADFSAALSAAAGTTSPSPAPPPASAPASSKVPMRTRRLLADAEQMARVFADSPHIRVRPAAGSPAEAYEIDYRVRSLERGKNGRPVPRDDHRVQIQLTADYPRLSPKCRMLTPVFHPNIDPTTICVGDHWTAGERLADLVVRIGEIIAYQAYNIKSPLDAEAAMWADLNPEKLPTDHRSLRPPGME